MLFFLQFYFFLWENQKKTSLFWLSKMNEISPIIKKIYNLFIEKKINQKPKLYRILYDMFSTVGDLNIFGFKFLTNLSFICRALTIFPIMQSYFRILVVVIPSTFSSITPLVFLSSNHIMDLLFNCLQNIRLYTQQN